ncbi:hypothetical protein [Psychromonas sp. SP041]|uniref:hypothetical protein n=1 Tax=Psychromonas sp. SP041 TaxID=1365007 RepID=UPI0003FE4312|nr:hypothetical protein [Psychromonas sp. SP041]
MVDMKKKLIIHIGTPKTGTSFLQEVCIKNYDKLLASGVLYPGVESNSFVKKANIPINASHILRYFFNKLDKESICNLIKNDFISLFNFNVNTVLISDETLIAYNVPNQGNLFIFECLIEVCKVLNIELSFVAYYRKPSKYLPSHWAQLVKKHQETRSLVEFVEQEKIPYWSNLITLYKFYNKVSIYSYDQEAKTNKGISKSFFNTININCEELESLNNDEVNSSLSLNALTALRLINAEFENDAINEVEKTLTNAVAKHKLNKPVLSEHMESVVDKLYQSELDVLALASSNN